MSKAIGQVEIERMKETHYDGTRAGKNFSLERQVEPLVMDSEISGLADKHAFLKLGNNVARFSFLYSDMPIIAPDFVPRVIEDDELSFDPKTLLPRKDSASRSQAAVTKAQDSPNSATPVIDLEADPEHDTTLPNADPVSPAQRTEPAVVGSREL